MKLTPLKEPPEQILALIEEKLKHTYKERLLLLGSKGSLATGAFTPLSDIDLVTITRDGIDHYKEFMYGTTYIDIRIAPLAAIHRDIRKVTIDWPLRMGAIMGLRIHYQQGHTSEDIHEVFEETTRHDHLFSEAIDLHAFTEYYSKSYRAHAKGHHKQLQWTAVELVHQFALIIALLNKNYFTSQGPRKYIQQIEKFTYQPDGWREAIEQAMTLDADITMKGIQRMWKIVNLLSLKHKFATKRITQLDDIDFD